MTTTEADSPSNLHEASNPKLCLHASQDRRLTTSVTWPGSGSPDLYLVTTTVLPCVCCVSGPCQALKIQGRRPKAFPRRGRWAVCRSMEEGGCRGEEHRKKLRQGRV